MRYGCYFFAKNRDGKTMPKLAIDDDSVEFLNHRFELLDKMGKAVGILSTDQKEVIRANDDFRYLWERNKR